MSVTETAARTILDAEVAPPAQPLAALPANGRPLTLAPEQLATRPRLAAALVAAIGDCPAVAHDAKNAHHGYAYTSAEAILEAARTALSRNGLALIPVSQQVNGNEREGPDRYELAQQRLLLHVSGEAVLCTSAWPIIPQAGRPLDKATAAADTLSLAYFLRDLLLMPRVDPADEVAARNDSRQPEKGRKPQPTLPGSPRRSTAS